MEIPKTPLDRFLIRLDFASVKTTIDIPEKELEDALRFTGATTKRDAVVTALADFNRRHRVEQAVKLLGTFRSLASNEEIEAAQIESQQARVHDSD